MPGTGAEHLNDSLQAVDSCRRSRLDTLPAPPVWRALHHNTAIPQAYTVGVPQEYVEMLLPVGLF